MTEEEFNAGSHRTIHWGHPSRSGPTQQWTHSEKILGQQATPLADGTAATIAWWKADKPAVSV
ncbi:hypothetical protein J2W18_002582 [Rhodococcus cercidiphylli]|nr:hypothetical protein [Rhodococcus cercidiphylli]